MKALPTRREFLADAGLAAAAVLCTPLAGSTAAASEDKLHVSINQWSVGAVRGRDKQNAKITFDDDGLYRHPEIRELRDTGEEDPLEVVAREACVNYIKLDGNVGCMVNGAGLAMTTMDLIKMAGGQPANFLDVGGGASPDQIEKAFRILTADPNVRCILINIFGGVLRCDRVSAGLIQAAGKSEIKLPMVVRLQGTNVEEGRRMLNESGLRITVAEGLFEAAQKAVALLG